MHTYTVFFVATSRINCLQVDTQKQAEDYILKQRKRFGKNCPDYHIVEKTVTVQERRINV